MDTPQTNDTPEQDGTNEQSPPDSRELLKTLLVLGLVAAALVTITGVSWDESYEHSLIKLGMVEYPEGHPLPLAMSREHTIQDYPTIALLRLGFGPLVPNALRNWLFLMGTLAPVYLLTIFLTESRIGATAATILCFAGIHLSFDSVYHIWVWHEFYSYGTVGTGFMLLALALLAGGYLKSGVALSAMMIQIHIGQLPVLAMLCLVQLVRHWRKGEHHKVRHATLIGAVIATLCGALWILQSQNAIPVSTSPGPYFADEDPMELWHAAHAYTDYHRHLPRFRSYAILIGALTIFGMLATRSDLPDRARETAKVVLFYFALMTLLLLPIILTHHALGTDTPFLLLVWIPYRLMNHAAPIAISGVMALLVLSPRPAAFPAIAVALVVQLFGFLSNERSGEPLYYWVGSGFGLSFGLFGLAAVWSLMLSRRDKLDHLGIHAAMVAAAVGLGFVYRPVAALYAVAGAAIALAMWRYYDKDWLRALNGRRVVGTVLVLLAILICEERFAFRQHLPRDDYGLAIEQGLREMGIEQALILAEPTNARVLLNTGHPSILPAATRTVAGYMPELAPTLINAYRDLYNIDLGPNAYDNASDDPMQWMRWYSVWPGRSKEEWNALSDRYGFDFILIPDLVPLQLPVAVKHEGTMLYDARRP